MRAFTPLLVIMTGALGVTVAAQTPAVCLKGFYQRVSTGATSRGSNGTSAGKMLTRIDHESHRAWGIDKPDKRKHFIWGLQVVVQDQNLSTNESFTLQGHGEDPQDPNFPDPDDNFLNTDPIQLPPGSGTGAFLITTNFETPVQADNREDVFLGIGVAANSGWATDGVSLHINLGFQPSASFTVFDRGGAALGNTAPGNTYGYSWVTGSDALANSPRQYRIDALVATGCGNATGITNQTSYTISASPGTSSMFSGLNPDAADPPQNSGRKDDIGYLVTNEEWAEKPVAFLLSHAFLPADAPIGRGPGVWSIFPVGMIVVEVKLASAAGTASTVISFSDAMRKNLPDAVVWQCFCLNMKRGRLWAGGAVKQRFR